jgi:hypothetical protein
MDRPRLFRGLRIAVSALFLLACVLISVLWARSYFYSYVFEKKTSSRVLQLHSRKGSLVFWQQNLGRNPRIPASVQADLLAELSNNRTFVSNPISELDRFPEANGVSGFGHYERGGTTIVFAPYWFPVLLTATCAAVPWIPWSRSFSLRSLLVAMTLVALLLGAVTYAVR